MSSEPDLIARCEVAALAWKLAGSDGLLHAEQFERHLTRLEASDADTVDRAMAAIALLRETAEWEPDGEKIDITWLDDVRAFLAAHPKPEPVETQPEASRSPVEEDVAERCLLQIEEILQATPERSDFVDDLAQQQDQALLDIHAASQKALAEIRALTPSPQPQAPSEESEVEYEVWQADAFGDGDAMVAGSTSLKEAWHYAAVYGQDGPAWVVEVTRRKIATDPQPVAGGGE